MLKGRPKNQQVVEQQGEQILDSDIPQKTESQQERSSSNKNKNIKQNAYKMYQIQNSQEGPQILKISIEQIKRKIIKKVPQMKDQIDILDEKELRQVYQTLVRPNLQSEDELQEQSKIQHQLYQQHKPKKRSPEVQKMIQRIIEIVPYMQDQVETYNDEEITELFGELLPDLKEQKPQLTPIKGPNPTYNIAKIRQFLLDNMPEMKDEIKILEDKDLIEVYNGHKEKQKTPNKDIRLPKYSINSSTKMNGMMRMNDGFNKHPQQLNFPMKSQLPQQKHMPYEPYDPMSKFSGMKPQHSMGYEPSPTYDNNGWYNNYKSSRNYLPRPQFSLQRYANPNPIEVHNFHNNKRVSMPPPDQERYAKTVIIVHTTQPGFVPIPSRPKCRCECCMRMESEMSEPNTLSEFIQNIVPKYSYKR